jgi:hypothetical protein
MRSLKKRVAAMHLQIGACLRKPRARHRLPSSRVVEIG